jgi:hypothetical protein
MPDQATHNRRPPPLVLVLAVLAAIAATWWLLRTNTSAAARECLQLYAEASTAADSLVVDTTVTAGVLATSDPRSCGSMRTSSRWQ